MPHTAAGFVGCRELNKILLETMPVVRSSVAPFLALLDDRDVQSIALQKLNAMVDDFWHEIFDGIEKIEQIYESSLDSASGKGSSADANMAALVLAKVYYHMNELEDALTFALAAGPLLDLHDTSRFTKTIVAKALDEYCAQRERRADAEARGNADDLFEIDARLEAVVERTFARCFEQRDHLSALGLALEMRRIDVVRRALAAEPAALLDYTQRKCLNLIGTLSWRREVLGLIVEMRTAQDTPDVIAISECYVALGETKPVAALLQSLCDKATAAESAASSTSPSSRAFNNEHALTAFQIAFNLVDNATQPFVSAVRELIKAPAEAQDDAANADGGDGDKATRKPAATVRHILRGRQSLKLYLQFLYRNNHSDLMILRNMKNAVDARDSVLHGGIVSANALMHAGTTHDAFMRANLQWMARAANWAKFSATAALGVIHRGHLKEAFTLLQHYLPSANAAGGGNASAASSPYSEGGGLYALGLLHATHGEPVIDYLSAALERAAGAEVVQHGACLGLGVAAMGTANEGVFESLKHVLYADSAVSGEAAALGMGLTMVGTANQDAIQEMLAYAHDTQHEKIIRGLAMSLAFMMYGREEAAESMIEQLSSSKDAILRYGGMYTVSMAYAGTANNKAIRKLLNVAVSDVNDDVRRAAVTGLGFLLFREEARAQCPRVVALLCESYNAHVRYGAAMALGIACAGTGMREALDLLDTLREDTTDFVRQGAFIATAMVLQQLSAAQEPRVEAFRKLLAEKVAESHNPVMSKLGAILATGLLDAGGRNVIISLVSRAGQNRMPAIVGLALFLQYWYWYPLTFFVSLAFTPTAMIGLNGALEMPEFKFRSNAKPSLYAYPPDVKAPEKKKGERVKTAVLSYNKKGRKGVAVDDAKGKAAKEKMEGIKKAAEATSAAASSSASAAAAMDTDGDGAAKSAAAAATVGGGDAEMADASGGDTADGKRASKPAEPAFEILENPSRVTLPQLDAVSFTGEEADQRWRPVVPNVHGILLLQDLQPEKEVKLVTAAKAAAKLAADSVDDEEAPPFEPFTFDASKEDEPKST